LIIKNEIMTHIKKIIAAVFSILAFSLITNAQNDDWKSDRKISILLGLTQPLLVKGFNIEVNYIRKRLIVDFSHGVSLDFDRNLVSPVLKAQHVVVHMPFSTGIGVGYRFTNWLNVRVEPKWHRFEFYYNGETQNNATKIVSDKNNFSIGLGLYTFFRPFKKQENFLNGISIAPSVRFWPTVSSDFTNNKYNYQNKFTNKTETLKAPASGIGLTPLIINVSIGYTFDMKDKK
jgi:hypothetical protein